MDDEAEEASPDYSDSGDDKKPLPPTPAASLADRLQYYEGKVQQLEKQNDQLRAEKQAVIDDCNKRKVEWQGAAFQRGEKAALFELASKAVSTPSSPPISPPASVAGPVSPSVVLPWSQASPFAQAQPFVPPFGGPVPCVRPPFNSPPPFNPVYPPLSRQAAFRAPERAPVVHPPPFHIAQRAVRRRVQWRDPPSQVIEID